MSELPAGCASCCCAGSSRRSPVLGTQGTEPSCRSRASGGEEIRQRGGALLPCGEAGPGAEVEGRGAASGSGPMPSCSCKEAGGQKGKHLAAPAFHLGWSGPSRGTCCNSATLKMSEAFGGPNMSQQATEPIRGANSGVGSGPLWPLLGTGRGKEAGRTGAGLKGSGAASRLPVGLGGCRSGSGAWGPGGRAVA